MLDDLVEIEAPGAIDQALEGLGMPQSGGALDYLFWGRRRGVLPVWIAGGVTHAGRSVTGSGTTVPAAIWGVLGETAEAACGGEGPAALGAHTDPGAALRHASREAVERHLVRHWWRGGCSARLLSAEVLAEGLAALGGTSGPLALEIAAPEGLCLVMAAGFDADGQGFRFGAACRETLGEALRAALLELAQADFALDLARMKRDRFGPARLLAADLGTLRLAERVDRTGLLTLVATKPSAPSPAPPRPQAAPIATWRDLLHVAGAPLAPETAGPGAFGLTCPYTGAE